MKAKKIIGSIAKLTAVSGMAYLAYKFGESHGKEQEHQKHIKMPTAQAVTAAMVKFQLWIMTQKECISNWKQAKNSNLHGLMWLKWFPQQSTRANILHSRILKTVNDFQDRSQLIFLKITILLKSVINLEIKSAVKSAKLYL